MTSLTGCAGEQFASILRSMGFRSVEVKRSEFIASPPPAEAPQEVMPPSLGEIPEVPPDGLASLATSAEEGSPATDLSTASVEPSGLDVAQSDIPADGFCSEASRTDSDAATGAPPMPATSSEDKKTSEMIVIWRPDRSAFSRRSGGDKIRRDVDPAPRDEHSPNAQLGRQEIPGRRPGASGGGKRNKSRHGELASGSAKQAGSKAASRPDRREPVSFHEKHRQTSSDRDMPRSHSASERQPRATVDPNSPFAKLLELRSLLEEQSNKRP